MTSNEAVAVNELMPYLVGMKRALDRLGASPEAYGNLLYSAEFLADRAHKVLGAGIDGSSVRERWEAE